MKKGKFVVISGPSGVGKGTICEVLFKELNAWYSVSMTTRKIREGEVEGKTYYYISKEEFEKRIKEDKFIEYNFYSGNYYGTPKDKILEKLEQGVDVFLEVDVNGAKKLKSMFPNALLIYIAPANFEVLRERLIRRGTEDIETIENRLNIAKEELKQIDFYDYVVVNEDLNTAIAEVRKIINEEI